MGSGTRIVSLLPSATEIVCAVGAAGELVAVSHECDYPPTVAGLPVLTSARISAGTTSREIDAAVRAVVHDALSIYTVDEEKLAALAPDVIVTQDLCEVCAVSLDDVRRAVAQLARRDAVEIVSLRPTRLAHVFADIETVARAIGRATEGGRVRAALEARTRAIAERAGRLPSRPRVVSIEWLEPIMLGGTWMPELIELAGGIAAGARAGEPAPTVTLEELGALAPDVVLVKPCGFRIERTMGELPLVERIARVVGPSARVFVSDGNAFFNRPGPRLVESVEILAAATHPDAFVDFAGAHASALRPIGLR